MFTHSHAPHRAGAAPLSAIDDHPLEAADFPFGEPADDRHYCPAAALADFALLMAGHGRCVNTAMMLGDREYAMWQLACARALDDAELQRVASRLFTYFDDAQHTGTPVLGTA